MENQELRETILKIVKENQNILEEVKSCLEQPGGDFKRLNHYIKLNRRNVEKLSELIEGDRSGKTTGTPII